MTCICIIQQDSTVISIYNFCQKINLRFVKICTGKTRVLTLTGMVGDGDDGEWEWMGMSADGDG